MRLKRRSWMIGRLWLSDRWTSNEDRAVLKQIVNKILSFISYEDCTK